MLSSFARRSIAAALAMAGAAALPLAAAAQARADQVRQRQQWVLNELDVPAAWKVTKGQNVTVAVIDSGVDPTVSDLTGSVTTGPDLTNVGTPVSNPNWGDHGTWMASLIAGHGHGRGGQNGILGVAPKSKILSIRVITDRSDPGYARYQSEPPTRGQQELATAIKYAVTHGASVISMSLGYDAPSVVVRSALQYALSHNVVVVASSGNSGTVQTSQGRGHAPYSFPADYPGVLGVAAVTQSGQPAYFSSENLSVEVAAPGVDVPAQGRGSKYWLVSGTSPACALTAGVAALIKSRYPHITVSQVRRAITRSTANRPPHGYDDQVGFGTVDAAAALRAAGRLLKQIPANRTAAARAATAGHFGNGAAGVPPLPVAPRGNQKLLILVGIATASLLAFILSMWRLAAGLAGNQATRRAARQAAKRGLPPSAAGYGHGSAVNVIYAPWAGHPHGGNVQAAGPESGAGQPGRGPGAQGFGAAGFGAPGFAAQGQQFQGQQFQGQQFQGQQVPGQPISGQVIAGQAFPPQPAQPQPAQPQPAPPWAAPGQPTTSGWGDQEAQPTLGQEYRSWAISEPRHDSGVGASDDSPGSDQAWSPDYPQRSAFARPPRASSPGPADPAWWQPGPADSPAAPSGQAPWSEAGQGPADLSPVNQYERPPPDKPTSSAGPPSVWDRVLPTQAADPATNHDAAPGTET